ncbi:unnamed protein product, partial [Anisakis simplex]|uniref:Chitin-binding type-2 domain-containing protein n=1 Tax=Anisakis simplex TaxID=6269 RepID=A0A0M3JGW9_ANISI
MCDGSGGVRSQIIRPDFSCSGYPDGMYAQGCSSDFTACVAGNPIAMKCPANLKYDQDEKKCLYEYQVSACQATPPTTEEPSSTDTMADFVTPITPSTLPIGASPCSALSEGIYGQG